MRTGWEDAHRELSLAPEWALLTPLAVSLIPKHWLWGGCCSVCVVQLSCAWLFATPWTEARQASLSFIISRSLLKLLSIESVMSSNHLVLSHLLLLLPSIFPCIRIFSNELALCIRWPKYWNFSFSISLSNEYSELISFRTIFISLQSKGLSRVFSNKSYSSKASILRHSAFFMVQLSHSCIIIGKP